MQRARRNRVLRVGVTGGIGSGKSVVCSMFASRGCPVFSADNIARDLTEHDDNTREAIRRAFGADIYCPDGLMDRRKLARIVFSDTAARTTVNRIVHPRVFKELDRRVASLPPLHDSAYVLVEAALIYESGMDRRLDYTVVVHAPKELRIARVMRRDRCSRAEVLARMRSQMPVKEKLERADFIIANDGTERELKKRVAFLDGLLQQIALKNPST